MNRRPAPSRGAASKRWTRRDGFTLGELLVVIGIIILLVAVGLPATNTMIRSAQESGTVNRIDSAVAAARAFATRSNVVANGDYLGAAAVFAPDPNSGATTIYITRHTRTDSSDKPEYTRVEDPIALPGTVGVVGISKVVAGGIRLTPVSDLADNPRKGAFALRFDRHGVLIASRPSSDSVMYDINGNGAIVSDESLPAVIGIIVYNRPELVLEHGDLTTEADSADSGDNDSVDWIIENGKHMIFNRYSGARVKELP